MSTQYVPKKISALSYGDNEVVPVIASFNCSGSIKPLYVQIRDEIHKIQGYVCRYERPLYIYSCTILQGGHTEQCFSLTYHPQEAAWTIKF